MTTPQAASGSESFLSYALETTSGTWQAPTDVLYWTSNTLESQYDVMVKAVAGGSRAAERIVKQGKMKNQGAVGFPLYADGGIVLVKGALGQDAYMTALTADTTSATVTTAGGKSTLVLTAGASYTLGAWLQFGSGATAEYRQVSTYTSGSKTLVVDALITNATTAAGLAVQQVGQHHFSSIPGATAGSQLLPTFSLEDNLGRLYSRQYAGCFVSKYDLKGGKDSIDVSASIIGTVRPNRPGSPTAFAPTTAEDADLLKVFGINDAVIVTAGDPLASGSSAVQMIPVEDWEVSVDNGMLEKPQYDRTRTYKAYPGIAKSTVKYKYVNTSLRPAEWEDFIDALKVTPTPFAMSAALYDGAAWNAYGIYAAQMAFTKYQEIKAVNDVIGVQIEGTVVPTSGNLLDIFVVNSSTSSY